VRIACFKVRTPYLTIQEKHLYGVPTNKLPHYPRSRLTSGLCRAEDRCTTGPVAPLSVGPCMIAEMRLSENRKSRSSKLEFSPKAHVASLLRCSLIVDLHVVDQAGPEGVSPSDHGQEARHTWARRFPIRNQQSAIQTQPTTAFPSADFADFRRFPTENRQPGTENCLPIINYSSSIINPRATDNRLSSRRFRRFSQILDHQRSTAN